MKKKMLASLIAACIAATCLAGGIVWAGAAETAPEEEHQHEMQKSCLYEWCYCGYVIQGPAAHLWYWGINGSSGHYKRCGNCYETKDHESHGYITVNGVRYCGSCGYTP